ncbi:MAG: hypothetical protein CVU57_15520 [Deltaproteobacteria bacterium HGW-Deltaproteobacteria-15]|nr:MAG: hypothetical protein CVU57_15520 [Deltaproteobacteria bacterium HGW-Deltaproteobacteria-15]
MAYPMIRSLAKVAILAAMLLGLPLLGILLASMPLQPYLEFPPATLYVTHAPFSWVVFLAYALFVLLIVTPFLRRNLAVNGAAESSTVGPATRFPWWGWLGLVFGVLSWILAWTRFPWFEALQTHTFTPLWLSYVITMNALAYRRTGTCLLIDRPIAYLLLFPVSAIFWWFFEYLNRFVQNWYYVGPPLNPIEYFWYATPAFSTVLPAFTATREWVLSFSWPKRFHHFLPISVPRPKTIGALVLMIAALGLAGLGVFPDYLFALLWISPLLILVSLKAMFGEHHIFSNLNHGDWSLVIASAVSALVCGFFWEMWNFFSLAKWIYQVPFVARFHIFEMPLIGYAGYLPFGVECAVIVEMVMRKDTRSRLHDAG